MILLLDALETETSTNDWLVEQAFVVFSELEQNGVHRLAELAVQRISEGLVKLRQLRVDARQQMALSRRASEQSQPQLTLDTASMMDWTADSVMGTTGTFLLEDPGLQSYHPSANPFRPLSWTMANAATTTSHPSSSATQSVASTTPPTMLSPVVPVSQVTATPFPIMTTPPFMSAAAAAAAIPVTNSPFAVGLQPRLTGLQQAQQQRRPSSRQAAVYSAVYQGLPTAAGTYGRDPQAQQLQQQQEDWTAVNAGMGFPAVGPAGQQQQRAPQQVPQRQHSFAGAGGGGQRPSSSSGSARQSGAGQRVEKTARSQQRRR